MTLLPGSPPGKAPPVICVAKPSVMHFGGFELHRPHRQMCRLMNTSMRTQRFTIHNPTTPYFKARQSKLGAVAPGMWEEVMIEFTPDEHRYYYDSLRVMCPGCDPVVVPIHAYPVVNMAEFPTAIDFGKCSLSESMCKVVPLSSSVPIEFEFELRVIKPSAFFQVSPIQGVIPANGKIDICINFHPLQMYSAQMNIEVHISQYDFEPFVCSLTGVGMPESFSSEPLPLELSPLRTRDIPTLKRKKTKIKITRPLPPPLEEAVTIDGILMPADFSSVHAVSSVLTAEAGKLKLKDLKAALADQQNQKGAVQGRQLRAAMFMKQLADETDRERKVEIRPALADCKVRTWGDTTVSEEQISESSDTRAASYQQVIDRQHAEGRGRTMTEASDGRPVHNAKAVPMFYTPSWDLDTKMGESDQVPALKLMQRHMVSLAGSLMTKARLDSRISALRAHLASFGSKEQIEQAISGDNKHNAHDQKESSKSFGGVPVKPSLPLFREQELGAPDSVKTIDLCCFDDAEPVPLEVPKYFEMMEYSCMSEVPVPAYTAIETSRLLESGAEEEQLVRGWRPALVRPAVALQPTGPPGDMMSHTATVIPAPPKQPVHSIPEQAREPVPFNTWDLLKPPNRLRPYTQLLDNVETSCTSVLRPVAPDTTVTSLEEACGSNAVLSMWQLPSLQDVLDHSSARLTRSWFDDSVPRLLSAPTPDMENIQDDEEQPAEAAEGEETVFEKVPHPYQEAVEKLAQDVKDIRAGWSARLEEGLDKVNHIIVNPKIKLK